MCISVCWGNDVSQQSAVRLTAITGIDNELKRILTKKAAANYPGLNVGTQLIICILRSTFPVLHFLRNLNAEIFQQTTQTIKVRVHSNNIRIITNKM